MTGFDLKVRVRLAEDETARSNGWRGLCSFDGVIAPDGAHLFGCELTLHDDGELKPSVETLASLRFWVPISYASDLRPGLRFCLFEGGHKKGSGVIDEGH